MSRTAEAVKLSPQFEELLQQFLLGAYLKWLVLLTGFNADNASGKYKKWNASIDDLIDSLSGIDDSPSLTRGGECALWIVDFHQQKLKTNPDDNASDQIGRLENRALNAIRSRHLPQPVVSLAQAAAELAKQLRSSPRASESSCRLDIRPEEYLDLWINAARALYHYRDWISRREVIEQRSEEASSLNHGAELCQKIGGYLGTMATYPQYRDHSSLLQRYASILSSVSGINNATAAKLKYQSQRVHEAVNTIVDVLNAFRRTRQKWPAVQLAEWLSEGVAGDRPLSQRNIGTTFFRAVDECRPEVVKTDRQTVGEIVGLPPDIQAKVLLIYRLLVVAETAPGLTPDERHHAVSRVRELAERLFDASSKWQLHFSDASSANWPDDWINVETVARGAAAPGNRIGLAIASRSDSRDQTLVKPALRYRLPDSPAVLMPLRALAASLAAKPGTDDKCHRLVNQFAEELKEVDSVQQWWRERNDRRGTSDTDPGRGKPAAGRSDQLASLDADDVRLRLYDLICRLTLLRTIHPEASIDAVLSNLAAEGFKLDALDNVPFEVGKQRHPEGGYRVIDQAFDNGRGLVGTGLQAFQSRALRTPEGDMLFPAVWLQIPRADLHRPLVQCLTRLHPILIGLRRDYEDWDGWTHLDNLTVRLVYSESAELPSDARQAGEAFAACYRRSRSGSEGHQHFHKVAVHLYDSVKDHFPLKLDPQTLNAQRITAERAADFDLKWDEGEARPGEVLEILDFGSESKRPVLRVSLGTKTTDFARKWLTLPRLSTSSQAPHWLRLLGAFDDKMQVIPWENSPADKEAELLKNLKRDWISPGGGRYFDEMMQALRRSGEETERYAGVLQRWELLAEKEEFAVYPHIDFESDTVSWPTKAPEHDSIDWEHDSAKLGTLVGAEVFFSLQPQGAKGKFSLGPSDGNSRLDIAQRLLDLVEHGGEQATPVVQGARGLVQLSKRILFRGESVDQVGQTMLVCLDGLITMCGSSPDAELRRRCDDILAGLVQWGEAAKRPCAILPKDFTFSRPVSAEAVPELAAQAPVRFIPNTKPNDVVLLRFGLQDRNGVRRTPKLEISAGPEPDGYGDLIAELESLRPESDELLKKASRWAEERLHDRSQSLQYPIITEFYGDFWQALGSGASEEKKAQGWSAARDALGRVLKDALNCTMFYPSSLQDFDTSWFEVVNDSRSDRVKRVRQPGLSSPQGLVSKAIVELA